MFVNAKKKKERKGKGKKMLLDLIVKMYITPENILAILGQISIVVLMCLIFKTWGEKWWKSLIPVYGTYIIYKHTWKDMKWMFAIQLALGFANAHFISRVKKNITGNIINAVRTYIDTKQLDLNIEIDVNLLLLYVALALVCGLCVWIIKRITYMKICDTLYIDSIVLKILTFLLPEIILFVDYFFAKKNYIKNER